MIGEQKDFRTKQSLLMKPFPMRSCFCAAAEPPVLPILPVLPPPAKFISMRCGNGAVTSSAKEQVGGEQEQA